MPKIDKWDDFEISNVRPPKAERCDAQRERERRDTVVRLLAVLGFEQLDDRVEARRDHEDPDDAED